MSSVYPGFLIGALSVQVSEEFAVAEAVYGWALGGFFLASAVGSATLGHVAQRIGPRRQLMLLLGVGAAMQLLIAGVAQSFAHVVGFLVVCGFANAGNQTAVNLALARGNTRQLGFAISLKQSGMPAASLLSGLAVPSLALTVGWRWGFVFGAGVSMTAMWVVSRSIPAAAASVAQPSAHRPDTARNILWWAAASGALMSFGAGALNAWLVASGVDAGLGEGAAGLSLSLGAAMGVTMRLVAGRRLDSMSRWPFTVGGTSALIGAAGLAALAVRAPTLHVGATVIAFALGWIWPVFTNYGIVRANAGAAAAATGTTQTGVYIGVFSAPLLTGPLIEAAGYEVMWVVVAAVVALGALIALRIARHF